MSWGLVWGLRLVFGLGLGLGLALGLEVGLGLAGLGVCSGCSKEVGRLELGFGPGFAFGV